jgi:hypothetical protein
MIALLFVGYLPYVNMAKFIADVLKDEEIKHDSVLCNKNARESPIDVSRSFSFDLQS